MPLLRQPRVVVSGRHHPGTGGTGSSPVREALLQARDAVHRRREAGDTQRGERAVERVHVGIDDARGDDRTLDIDGTAPPAHETPDGVVIA
jgi:hypothetical protein